MLVYTERRSCPGACRFSQRLQPFFAAADRTALWIVVRAIVPLGIKIFFQIDAKFLSQTL